MQLEKNITLPYYDCASDYSVNNNLMVPRLNKKPFNSAYIALEDRYSTRDVAADDTELASCRRKVKNTFRNQFETTLDFQNHLRKGIHNFLHVWVGNDMSDLSYASFDPVFWFHHANVDRLWAKWQNEDGKSIQEREFRNNDEFLSWDFSARGFNGLAYKDFMNNQNLPSLGYGDRIKVVYEDEQNIFKSSKRTTEEDMKKEINIIIKNLTPTTHSYLIHASYRKEDKNVHLGTFTILGYGKCCKNGICTNLAKKSQTYDDAIDVSHAWEDLRKREEISINLRIFNISKKTNTTMEEFQSILKNTVKQVSDIELTWEIDHSRSENKFPKITIAK